MLKPPEGRLKLVKLIMLEEQVVFLSNNKGIQQCQKILKIVQ